MKKDRKHELINCVTSLICNTSTVELHDDTLRINDVDFSYKSLIEYYFMNSFTADEKIRLYKYCNLNNVLIIDNNEYDLKQNLPTDYKDLLSINIGFYDKNSKYLLYDKNRNHIFSIYGQSQLVEYFQEFIRYIIIISESEIRTEKDDTLIDLFTNNTEAWMKLPE